MMEALEEKAFILKDKRLVNIKELHEAMMQLSDEEFSYYANDEHNYFADWVDAVLEEKKLSEKLRKASGRIESIAVLEQAAKKSQKEARKPAEEPKKIEIKEETKVLEKHVESNKMEEPKKPIMETKEILQKIEKDEAEIKNYLWHHHPWEMAKEFMYGMALGIIVGLILSRILLPG